MCEETPGKPNINKPNSGKDDGKLRLSENLQWALNAVVLSVGILYI